MPCLFKGDPSLYGLIFDEFRAFSVFVPTVFIVYSFAILIIIVEGEVVAFTMVMAPNF